MALLSLTHFSNAEGSIKCFRESALAKNKTAKLGSNATLKTSNLARKVSIHCINVLNINIFTRKIQSKGSFVANSVNFWKASEANFNAHQESKYIQKGDFDLQRKYPFFNDERRVSNQILFPIQEIYKKRLCLDRVLLLEPISCQNNELRIFSTALNFSNARVSPHHATPHPSDIHYTTLQPATLRHPAHHSTL